MCKKISKILGVAIIMASLTGLAFGADPVTRTISATIPVENGFDVTISKIDPLGTGNPIDDVWVSDNETSIHFDTLTYSNEHHIFLADYYFAIDLGVRYNGGNNWTISHARTSFLGATANLDNNVNVSFVKVVRVNLDDVETSLGKFSYDNSNQTYTKANLSGGWLRIYYGIGCGDLNFPDNPGVDPINTEKPAGTYSGEITLTLTVS